MPEEKHPLICPDCGEYRYIEYKGVRFEEEDKGFGIVMPAYECRSCGQWNTMLPKKNFIKFKDEMMPSIKAGDFVDMPLKYVFSKLDEDKRFTHFNHLEFDYDPRDNYVIPGLQREWDDGYLTPVFFDKDVLLYYNGHTDYSVELGSFSSGNIYKDGEPMFNWGFGINRSGKLFKWLGDLDTDFKNEDMLPHLKRFQASNVPSDHDVVSKFYFSQNPFSEQDAFQTSDNETMLFSLLNDLNTQILEQFTFEITKIDIGTLAENYRAPVMEEHEQIFNTYISLNKFFIENIQAEELRKALLAHGLSAEDLKKDGNKLGSLKLLTLFLTHVMNKEDANNLIAPLFVLSDLRQLQGHLHDQSFDEKYQYCKERLGLESTVGDLEVYKRLVGAMIIFYQGLIAIEGGTYE